MAARKAFPLRLSQELYDELRRWADQDFRSVNGQIEYLLREAVRQRRRKPDSRDGTDPGPQPETKRS